MKRILALIIVFTIIISCFALGLYGCSSDTSTVAVQGVTDPQLQDESGVGYNINSDGTLSVSSYYGEDKDVSIPLEYESKPVKTIAQSAFKNSDIESVTLPDGLEAIEGYAFALCGNLEVVNIPDSVTAIGKNAFFATFALKEIELPESLLTIDINAFNASAVEEIIIPKKVETIGEFAFSNCTNLKSVEITGKNTEIASNAFDAGSDIVITAPKGSQAIKTAKENGLYFIET